MGVANNPVNQLVKFCVDSLKPRPNLSGAEWANDYFVLSAESSSIVGKVKLRPYQEEILNCMTDFKTQFVVVKKSTRVGYTIMLNMAQGFFIEQRPASILMAQPNDSEIQGYAEDEFEPMVRDNRGIKALITESPIKGKKRREKTIKKFYRGGIWEGVGAESDKNFNRRTVKVCIGDEIDAWKSEVNRAGDTLATFFRRSSDFWDRKNIIGGKPIGREYNEEDENNKDGVSKVDKWFKKGDQRQRCLPCPKCGYYQPLEWEYMKWDKDYDENGKVIKQYPETAHFKCRKCGFKIEDKHKRDMDAKGKWIATKSFKGIASFYVWAVLSYSPNTTWSDIVSEYLDAVGDPIAMKAFFSETLAKTWEDDYDEIKADSLVDRKEEYEAQVPDGVLILTFGADTQDYRIECEVVGWGANEESWSIDYQIFYGDTSKPEVWAEFDKYLMKQWYHESGGIMKVYCGGLDTQGHRTKQAYAFCKSRFNRRVFAFKGSSVINAPIAPRLASFKNKANIPLFMIGTNVSKDVLMSHIMTEEKGAGYMHFPNKPQYTEAYFKQLTAEKRNDKGAWIKFRKRNEALDVRVYAYASLFVAGVDLELLALRGKPMLVSARAKKKTSSKPKKVRDYRDEF